MKLRITTYNIHKCRGLDQRTSSERIAKVIRETEADIVALQEVLSHQMEEISESCELPNFSFGENRKHLGSGYGNATLSRWPMPFSANLDLTVDGREPRGVIRSDIELPNGQIVHVLNLHLGTGFMERREQARRLLSNAVVFSTELNAPRIILGDFNEWTRGLTTRMLRRHFRSAELTPEQEASQAGQRRIRSYPGILPVLHLDHVYFDKELTLVSFRVFRSRTALVASDHLPLIAEFESSS